MKFHEIPPILVFLLPWAPQITVILLLSSLLKQKKVTFWEVCRDFGIPRKYQQFAKFHQIS